MKTHRDHDVDDDRWDDEEADFAENFDDQPTVPCPYCRREILEDSPRCAYCERYISEEDHAPPHKPVWVIITAVVCLLIAVWWVFNAF